MTTEFVLPDLLNPNLAVVFCGTAAGRTSAEGRAYYANPSNFFWKVLHETGLTSSQLGPAEFHRLLEFKIGLTDLCKDDSGNDDQIRKISKSDSERLKEKLRMYRPRVLAFTSKSAARSFYGKAVQLGEQVAPVEGARVFVLPSTSLSSRWQWSATGAHWKAFADEVSRMAGT